MTNNNPLWNYLHHRRSERRGILGLLCLLALTLTIPQWYSHRSAPAADWKRWEAQVEAFERRIGQEGAGKIKKPVSTSLRSFDPNTATLEELVSLGLSERCAHNIVNYREKVGPFDDPDELRKIYTLSAAQFERLRPYVRLPSREVADTLPPRPKPARAVSVPATAAPFDPNEVSAATLRGLGLPETVVRNWLRYREKGGRFYRRADVGKIYGMDSTLYRRLAPLVQVRNSAGLPARQPDTLDINRADSMAWRSLRGIGPYYARRIVGFRKSLGGFYSVEQVGETYSLPDSTFQSIRPRLRCSGAVRKININRVTADTLAAHPYLRWREARGIINYRDQHGSFSGPESLKRVLAVPTGKWDKLLPYLKFGEMETDDTEKTDNHKDGDN